MVSAFSNYWRSVNLLLSSSHKRFYFKFALQGYNHDDVIVPLSMFRKAHQLSRMLDLGLGKVYNVTVNINHLNQQLSLDLRQLASKLEVCSLSSEVKMKIPGLVSKHFLTDIFKKTRQYSSN